MKPNPYPELSAQEAKALCRIYYDCQQYINKLPQTIEKLQLSVILSFAGAAICESLDRSGNITAEALQLLMPENKYTM